jgi:hypothetical protein
MKSLFRSLVVLLLSVILLIINKNVISAQQCNCPNLSGSGTVNFNTTINGCASVDSFETPSPLVALASKSIAFSGGSWVTVESASGAGIVRGIWIAIFNAQPNEVFFNAFFDGAANPQIGSTDISGNLDLSISLQVLFTSVIPIDATGNKNYSGSYYWSTDVSGSDMYRTTSPNNPQMNGYWFIDMPYSNGFQMNIYCTSCSGQYWIDVDYTPLPIQTSPLRLHIQPFYQTSISNNAAAGEYPEVSLLGVPAINNTNGVYYKGIKFIAHTNTGNADSPVYNQNPAGSGTWVSWAEGRFRFYYGGPGMATNTVGVYTATTTTSTNSYYGTVQGGTQIGSSSGSEDYFRNGFDWTTSYGIGTDTGTADGAGVVGAGCYATNTVGTIYCGFANWDYSDVVAYRIYPKDMHYAPPGTAFVATMTANDQALPVQVTILYILGVTFYYA